MCLEFRRLMANMGLRPWSRSLLGWLTSYDSSPPATSNQRLLAAGASGTTGPRYVAPESSVRVAFTTAVADSRDEALALADQPRRGDVRGFVIDNQKVPSH